MYDKKQQKSKKIQKKNNKGKYKNSRYKQIKESIKTNQIRRKCWKTNENRK